jgi:hypothetical protein
VFGDISTVPTAYETLMKTSVKYRTDTHPGDTKVKFSFPTDNTTWREHPA